MSLIQLNNLMIQRQFERNRASMVANRTSYPAISSGCGSTQDLLPFYAYLTFLLIVWLFMKLVYGRVVEDRIKADMAEEAAKKKNEDEEKRD